VEWSAKLREGETVVVLAASGIVGQVAVQAARLLGAGRIVAAGRRADALERARELGADETVVLGDQDIECAGCRAKTCPVAGHPCLSQVPVEAVLEAVELLAAPLAMGAPA